MRTGIGKRLGLSGDRYVRAAQITVAIAVVLAIIVIIATLAAGRLHIWPGSG